MVACVSLVTPYKDRNDQKMLTKLLILKNSIPIRYDSYGLPMHGVAVDSRRSPDAHSCARGCFHYALMLKFKAGVRAFEIGVSVHTRIRDETGLSYALARIRTHTKLYSIT